MKFINNLSVLALSVFTLCLIGCVGSDFEGTQYPGNEFTVRGTAVSALGVAGDFDIGKADVQSVSYSVNVRGEAISGVDVVITHDPSGASGSLGTSTGPYPDARTMSLNDALSATGVAVADVEVGDMWTVDYQVGGTSTGTTFKVNTVTTFKSALAGFMSATTTLTNQMAGYTWDGCEGQVWTGQIELKRQQLNPNDDGEYIVFSKDGANDAVEDMSFGAYYPCYNADAGSMPLGDLRLIDVDNKLSISGASQWGETYSLTNVAVDGTSLSFNWTNNYGEGAMVVLVRDDGEDWNPDLN